MTTKNSGFRHYRNISMIFKETYNEGGITMAFNSPRHVCDLTADDVVDVAFAFCSAEDNFCRETGREIAAERLAATPLSIPGNDFVDLLRSNLGSLVSVTADANGKRRQVLPGLDADQGREFERRVLAVQGF